MTPTPPDAKPQGTQYAIDGKTPALWWDSNGYVVGLFYFNALLRANAKAAERIEKLECEKDEIEQQAIAAGIAWAYERDALKAERDTALRALAEARLDAERLDWLESNVGEVRGFNWITRERGDKLWFEHKTFGEYETLREAIDAARQPEKDANNG